MIRPGRRDLMVTLVSVEETHPVMPGSCFNQLVDLWKREAVLGAGFVEVGEVHANPPLPILLLDHYRVGQPIRTVDLLHRLGCEQLLDLLDHGLSLWDPHSTGFLVGRFVLKVHVKLMAHDFEADAKHLIGSPRKDLFVL